MGDCAPGDHGTSLSEEIDQKIKVDQNTWSHDVGFCVGALVVDDLNEMKLKHLFSRTFS